jgi:hypothetical protein
MQPTTPAPTILRRPRRRPGLPPRPAHRCVGHQGLVAAEERAGYRTDERPASAAATPAEPPDAPPDAPAAAPFGLPVLGELPRLAAALHDLDAADRHLLAAVATLAELHRDRSVEAHTGVELEHWVGIVARQTRMDRRLLRTCCQLLDRLPTLDDAVRRRRVSFAQLRGMALALRGAPRVLDEPLDRVLGDLLDGLEALDAPDPDVLVRRMTDALTELDPDELVQTERGAERGRYLQLQPRLDGTGGRFSGELDAAGLALLDAATTPPRELLDHPGGYGGARAETLLTRLASSRPDTAPAASRAPDDVPGQGTGWVGRLPAPRLVLRLPFDALLDDRIPADLLTQLIGGRLRLTNAAARRLIDTAGAELRAVVVDHDGSVLGVGRRTSRPPGWMSDVLDALHDTCTGPLCDRPGRGADRDHAVPFEPARPGDAPGTTDVANVGPLCPTTNRAKEAGGWRAEQTAAGLRTWTHTRTGLRTTSVPGTWRPPDRRASGQPPTPFGGPARPQGGRPPPRAGPHDHGRGSPHPAGRSAADPQLDDPGADGDLPF